MAAIVQPSLKQRKGRMSPGAALNPALPHPHGESNRPSALPLLLNPPLHILLGRPFNVISLTPSPSFSLQGPRLSSDMRHVSLH